MTYNECCLKLEKMNLKSRSIHRKICSTHSLYLMGLNVNKRAAFMTSLCQIFFYYQQKNIINKRWNHLTLGYILVCFIEMGSHITIGKTYAEWLIKMEILWGVDKMAVQCYRTAHAQMSCCRRCFCGQKGTFQCFSDYNLSEKIAQGLNSALCTAVWVHSDVSIERMEAGGQAPWGMLDMLQLILLHTKDSLISFLIYMFVLFSATWTNHMHFNYQIQSNALLIFSFFSQL